MATYFGEVLEPRTRGIFEDFRESECDSDSEDEPTEFRLKWLENVPSSLDTLFVYHSKLSVAFAEAFLIPEDATPVAKIQTTGKGFTFDKYLQVLKPKFLPSTFYLENNIMTCLVSPTSLPDIGYNFAECISEVMDLAERVVVFTNESSSSYKTQDLGDLPPAFMRQLKTSHTNTVYHAEKLPVPNMVTGIPAAIASWCQICNMEASLFVCYSDQQKLDSLTAEPYLSVLKRMRPELIKNTNPNFSSKKYYGNPDIIGGSSNIYI